jgi:hypothetical protein
VISSALMSYSGRGFLTSTIGSMRIRRAKDSALRIVVWNMRMGLSRKWSFLCDLKPDVAILPEVGKILPTPIDHGVWVGSNPNKGLGVVSFGPHTIARDCSYDDSLEWVAPIRVDGPLQPQDSSRCGGGSAIEPHRLCHQLTRGSNPDQAMRSHVRPEPCPSKRPTGRAGAVSLGTPDVSARGFSR